MPFEKETIVLEKEAFLKLLLLMHRRVFPG